jgi:hypothetical protein
MAITLIQMMDRISMVASKITMSGKNDYDRSSFCPDNETTHLSNCYCSRRIEWHSHTEMRFQAISRISNGCPSEIACGEDCKGNQMTIDTQDGCMGTRQVHHAGAGLQKYGPSAVGKGARKRINERAKGQNLCNARFTRQIEHCRMLAY